MDFVTRDIVIGPLLKRGEGYAFDTWSLREGLRGGYAYGRIEEAHYARNATIRMVPRGAVICQTLDEFRARTASHGMQAAA
jgi:hypothetical protein